MEPIVLSDLKDWRSRATGHRIWPGPLLGALCVGVCAAALMISPLGEMLEKRYGLWALFHLRGVRPAPPEVVIIAMPRNTGERISVRQDQSGDDPCADLRVDSTPPTHRPLGEVPERWNRCHHVELMRMLVEAKPRVIVMDVTFRPRDTLPPAEDRALRDAIRAAGNVILAQSLKVRRNQDGNLVEDGPVELSRPIADAALGIAPMPLPRSAPEDRVEQF